ncbi:hypothetical protein MAPG_02914 [Magnaporthiopsis poae ATCC 64411]|uniref:Uncharacterized protein n=1 Tax=Magnaporthiopsis poae (strain ATCC 64411 / 73-15) TaxID=644358 RepID=A0A0C4DSN2_MAGP6|nr:hypothetical protein MAPG_02914 [Magnaporthiopsis poae ATCC 64411]
MLQKKEREKPANDQQRVLSLAGPVPDRSAPLVFRCRRRCRRWWSPSPPASTQKGPGPTRSNRNQALSSPGLSACRLPRAHFIHPRSPSTASQPKAEPRHPGRLGSCGGQVHPHSSQSRRPVRLVPVSGLAMRPTTSCLPMGRPDRLGPAHTSLASTCRCLLAAPPFFVGPNLRPGRRLGTNFAVADFVSLPLSSLHPSLPSSIFHTPACLPVFGQSMLVPTPTRPREKAT